MTLLVQGATGQKYTEHPIPKVLVKLDGTKEDFSYFSVFAASASGMLAVVQQQDGAVRIYSADGRRIATFGRKGEGPGEFRTLNLVGWIADTLWVADNSLKRLTMITSAGKLIRTSVLPVAIKAASRTDSAPGFRTPSLLGVYADQTYMFAVNRIGPPPRAAAEGVRGITSWTIRAAGDGTLRKTIVQGPTDSCFLKGPNAELIVPLCAQPLSAAASDGTVRVFVSAEVLGPSGGGYTVSAIGSRSDTIFSRHYPISLERVPGRIQDSIRAAIDSGNPIVRALMGSTDLSEFYPPVSMVKLSPRGEVWIGLRSPVGATQREWRILDQKGRPVGSLWLPRSAQPLVVESRGAWAAEVDPDGIESVVLYARPGAR